MPQTQFSQYSECTFLKKLSEEVTLSMTNKPLQQGGSSMRIEAVGGSRKGMMEGDRDVGVWLEGVVEGGASTTQNS